MKHMKKIASFLLAAIMVLAMVVPAFAATVNVTDDTGLNHTNYKAYQVFTGTQATGSTVLGDIQWGTGVDKTGFVTDLKANATIGTEFEEIEVSNPDAAKVAEVIAKYANDSTQAQIVAKLAWKNKTSGTSLAIGANNLDTGYYLIVDGADVSGKDDVSNAALLQLTTTMTINKKTDKPTLTKEIKHNESSQWGVVGDNQIGDTVEFRITTTVPNVTYYDTYSYTIHDTLSSGLTLNESSIKVYTDASLTTELDSTLYTVETSGITSGESFKVIITIKDSTGVKVNAPTLYTGYTATLNKDAKIYNTGKEDNIAYLEYDNNPNGNGTGKTPEKKVYDWTFKMGINKVDNEGAALTGAKFVLTKKSITAPTYDADTDNLSSATDLIALIKDGSDYRVATPAEITAGTGVVYIIDAGNPTIKGLDDSIPYYLYEVKAPDGYNLLSDPVTFKITADYNEDGSALKSDMPTVVVGTGTSSTTLSTNIVNKQGSTLPTTGGIGTTIFYVLGSILVLGAVILLVTRRRMSR